ncbi:MAG TPA: hypothetical protein VFS08_17100 [Gemmatimonadaceae bacterium]|nr:hypothetical protein [Gemmatimonadaceae bacterium]
MVTRALRPAALLLVVVAAGCLARPALAPPPEPGVDPLAASTSAIAAASVRAITTPRDSAAPSRVTAATVSTASGPQPSAGDLATAGAARLVDDVAAALVELQARRAAALADSASPADARARTLTRLGLWDDAGRLVAEERSAGRATPALVAAEAELLRRRHRYREAVAVVDSAIARAPRDRDLRLARGWLAVERWTLDSAAAVADALLAERSADAEALLLRGRVQLLAKQYDAALATAQRLQQVAPDGAAGFLLEADVRFWREDPAGAEAPLRAALERDPFDPDARFAYGYAIWRRVDARQLPQMAAQWNLAIAVDPLHYLTHWHFGNGHTDQTYADYAVPSDSVVRLRLKQVDGLISRGRIGQAVRRTRELEREFPESVLPAMARGSAFYMAYDMDPEVRLDSAQATFAAILARKRNYGPAHNGLAAVIKQRQFTVLQAYDSLERVIAATRPPRGGAFDSVFSDVRYFPGTRMRRMVWQQLGPTAAYLPLLARQGKQFHVPPLHHDLADAMKQPFFRGATTFDNRQWMDIRGVGSGATGIEYVERGSHWERMVVTHEYVHLVHGEAFTDAQARRVRQLYWNAMKEGRTLDYYAANNESEFLAQAYEAYLSPVKAHPLNHKSMNTRADLQRKDPATYAFVDSLARRERAYMAGDTAVFRSNWAQAYANLADSLRSLHMSDSARASRASDSLRLARVEGKAHQRLADSIAKRAVETHERLAEAAALLDTALVWDARYVPAMLSYAQLRRAERRFDDAERWIARAQATDSTFAPVYAERARLVAERAEAEHDTSAAVMDRQAALLERALALETDLAARATLNAQLRGLYARFARFVDALRVADDYVRTAPMVSTYLRDRRDEAAAFAASLRAQAGYASRVMVFFDSLAPLKPQNWGLRGQQAAALWAAGRAEDALRELEQAQRILRAGAGASGSFAALAAEIRYSQGDTAGARREIDAIIQRRTRPSTNDRRVVRVLALLGHPDSAERRHASYRDRPDGPVDRADVAFTRGVIAEARGDTATAEREYRAALRDDPYARLARLRLVTLLRHAGRGAEADAVIEAGKRLPLPLGPDFDRELGRAAGRAVP